MHTMPSDIAIPNGNEMEFAEIAGRLGCKKLCFLYNFDSYDEEKYAKKLELIGAGQDISIEIGLIVGQKNMDKASRHSKLLVAKSSGNDREIIESKKVKIIYGFEESQRKDHLHQRASGLNHVLCDLARKNNVAIGFSYSSLLGKNKMLSAVLAGRMMQNIGLCRKYKLKTLTGSFSERPYALRSHYDAKSLFKMLGMETK